MKLRSVALKLAMFTLITGTTTLILAALIGNIALFRHRYTVTAEFEDATGLLAGDVVTLAGVTVGKVGGVHVERGLAIVDLSIDGAVKVPRTTHIRIRYRNLVGQRVVNLEPEAKAPPYLESGDRVPSSQTEGPFDLDATINALQPIISGISSDDITTLAKALASLSQHKDDIDAVLADSATLLRTVSAKDQEVGRLVGNLSTVTGAVGGAHQDLEDLLSNLATVTGTLAGNSGEIDRILRNLDGASEQLGRLVADNRPSLDRDVKDLATLLQVAVRHQADLRQITKGLDDVFASTLRGSTYGEWLNLFVFSLCPATVTGCNNASSPATGKPALPPPDAGRAAQGNLLSLLSFAVEARP